MIRSLIGNEEVFKMLASIWKTLHDVGVDERILLDLVYLALYKRRQPAETLSLLTPLAKAIDAGINPICIAKPFIISHKLQRTFITQACNAYKAKKRSAKRENEVCTSDDDRKFLSICKLHKAKERGIKNAKTITQLLKEKFPKNHANLDSIRTKYYRFKKRYENPIGEISEDDFVASAIRYCFEHYFEFKEKTSEEETVTFQVLFRTGNPKSFYDAVMNYTQGKRISCPDGEIDLQIRKRHMKRKFGSSN